MSSLGLTRLEYQLKKPNSNWKGRAQKSEDNYSIIS